MGAFASADQCVTYYGGARGALAGLQPRQCGQRAVERDRNHPSVWVLSHSSTTTISSVMMSNSSPQGAPEMISTPPSTEPAIRPTSAN